MVKPDKNIYYAQTFAKIAIPFNFLIMLSVIFCCKWKRQLYPAKIVIFTVSLFEFLSCIGICLNPVQVDSGDINNGICLLQASFVMVFTISSWIQYSLISIETHYLIRKFTNTMKMTKDFVTKEVLLRQLPYYSVVVGFYFALALWMISAKKYEFLGIWCWLSDADMRVFIAYIPLWTSIVVVLVVNVDIIRIMRKSFHSQVSSVTNLNAPENSGSSKFKIPSKAKSEFIRLIAIAISFLVIHIPGSYLRVIQITNKSNRTKSSDLMNTFFAISLPIPGIINCMIWILSNKTVATDWRDNGYYIINRVPMLQQFMNYCFPSTYNSHIAPVGFACCCSSSKRNKNNVVVFLHRNSKNVLNSSAINLQNT